MKTPRRIFLAGALLTLTALAMFANRGAAAAPNDITLTGPAPNTVIPETDDYATQVLGDPWDMNNLDDLDQPYHFTNWGINSGIWSGSTTGAAYTASVFPQYQNYDNSYSYLGENDGVNKPIDATRFTRLSFRINTQTSSHAVTYFFNHYTYTPAGNSNLTTIDPGWHIYTVDLRSSSGGGTGNWSANGPYEGLRFDPPSSVAGNQVQIDWMRLTPDTGTPVNITWTATGGGTVNLYLSLSPTATDDNEYLIGTAAATAGTFTWNKTGVAPGTYYIHAELAGSWSSIGPLVVNTAPLARIDAPGPLTGEEYSYAALAESWDGTNPGQFDTVANVNNLTFAPDAIRGMPANDDPSLTYLNHADEHLITAGKYHYYNIRLWLSPPASRPFSPFNSGTRLFWGTGTELSVGEQILAPYNRWLPVAFDLRDLERVGNLPSDWGGDVSTFRFDPLELDDAYGEPGILPDNFMIQSAHLTSDPIAGRTGEPPSGLFGTIIRWTPLQGTGALSLYRESTGDLKSPDGGTLIASDIPLSQGQYVWDTSEVTNGTYHIYAELSDGVNTSRANALAPIIVDSNQQSTLFNDAPSTLWATDYINRLARLGIIGGSIQPDTVALFKPNNTATRAQLSKMVALAAGWTLINPGTPTFNDVPFGSTFYQFVETAAAEGVISGYDCGGPGEPCPGRYFRPNNNVTRGQTTKMIMLSFEFAENTSGGPHFSDVAVGSTFYANIETLYNLGIIGGYTDGTFRPSNLVTRAQVSKMISLSLDVNR